MHIRLVRQRACEAERHVKGRDAEAHIHGREYVDGRRDVHEGRFGAL